MKFYVAQPTAKIVSLIVPVSLKNHNINEKYIIVNSFPNLSQNPNTKYENCNTPQSS